MVDKLKLKTELKTKSDKIKFEVSKGFIKVCDFINPTTNSLYKKAMKVVECDKKVKCDKSVNKTIYDSRYEISDEDIDAISNDFGAILDRELDVIITKP